MRRKIFLSNFIFIFLCFFAFVSCKAQINNSDYFKKKYFGFCFGTNYTFIKIIENKNFEKDSVIDVVNKPNLGIKIGIPINFKITRRVNICVFPSLSFSTSNLNYYISKHNNINTIKVYTDFNSIENSVLLKYNSVRTNNINTYFLFGLKPEYFFTSSGKFYIKEEDSIIDSYTMPFKKFDISYELGVGINLFAQNNIQSFELIFSSGLFNIAVKDDSEFTQIFDYNYLKIITLAYIFNK